MLSSTSNSPLHEGKKTKTFISPNRFAVLASDVTGDDPVFDTAPSFRDDTVVSSPHTMDHRTEPPAPPLYIRNIINFFAFKNVLIKTVGLDGFTCKSTPSYLIVHPNGRDNFKALANYLMDTNASFHTFRPPVDRPFRIVIRNLHHSTLSADISTALLEEGHIEMAYRIEYKEFQIIYEIDEGNCEDKESDCSRSVTLENEDELNSDIESAEIDELLNMINSKA
ncbi:hypothetical protein QTP88_016105 [Uroleucon formosanum]